MDKMKKVVTHWTTRFLSYARSLSYARFLRLCLVNSVLLSIKSYWSQLFIVPKKIVKEVEVICRRFLWSGADLHSSKASIAWDTVCQPLKFGGINLKHFTTWNHATILKQLWDLTHKKDRLWLKWWMLIISRTTMCGV